MVLRIKFWKGDVRLISKDITPLRAFDMGGWSSDNNRFTDCDVRNDSDFKYSLYQWGPYIILFTSFTDC